MPAKALEQAELLVLDTIGCGIAASGEPTAKAVLGVLDGLGGMQACTLLGRSLRTNPLGAVLGNGCLIRVLDLNDYIGGSSGSGPEIGGHPSDNIPVALAIGGMHSRTGADVLACIVMAYEIFGRLKLMMDPVGVWDEVTSSGIVAAAICGKLMGLDTERLAHGMSLAAARAATPAIVRGGHVSAAKSIANALVAQSAVQAVLLAAAGVTGPLAVLDAPRGLREILFERRRDGNPDRSHARAAIHHALEHQDVSLPRHGPERGCSGSPIAGAPAGPDRRADPDRSDHVRLPDRPAATGGSRPAASAIARGCRSQFRVLGGCRAAGRQLRPRAIR